MAMVWLLCCCQLKFGIKPVVCINRFSLDTDAEVELVAKKALEAGAIEAVGSSHWFVASLCACRVHLSPFLTRATVSLSG